MKCWYPGPSVSEAASKEAQLSNALGRITPGWNELPDGPELQQAIAAGLVALKEPVSLEAKAQASAGRRAEAKQDKQDQAAEDRRDDKARHGSKE